MEGAGKGLRWELGLGRGPGEAAGGEERGWGTSQAGPGRGLTCQGKWVHDWQHLGPNAAKMGSRHKARDCALLPVGPWLPASACRVSHLLATGAPGPGPCSPSLPAGLAPCPLRPSLPASHPGHLTAHSATAALSRGRWCVLTCEASLSEALSVQISRGLPPPSAAVGAGLTGPRLRALSRLPRAPTQPACTPGRPPTTEQEGCSSPASAGSSQGPRP